MENVSSQTYEQASAQKLQSKATDPIHYNAKYSYRNSPYRHLHHQHGEIGTFKVHLVEAENLKRHHWSVLGMGPVKHLGLSRAHGQVSSYAVMKLFFRSRPERGGSHHDTFTNGSVYGTASTDPNNFWENESIASLSMNSSASSASNAKKPAERQSVSYSSSNKEHKSSIIRSNSNPVWPTLQSSSNNSIFNMTVEKGAMPKDGMEIMLSIQMREEWSAADSFVPVKGGGKGILGESELNLTPLVLKGFGFDSTSLEQEVDVMDEWITLSIPPLHPYSEEAEQKKDAGRVRVVISYEPNSLMPRRGDTVALEMFARQSLATCMFRPIINPLHPLKVKDVRGEYLLCSFDLPPIQDTHEHGNGTIQKGSTKTREGCLRLHRNCCFVIERTNIIDSAVNVALKPADVVMSSHIGQEVSHTLSPYVATAGKWDLRLYKCAMAFRYC